MAREETSPGGSRIFRHRPREGEPEYTGGDPALVEAVDDHLQEHFGDYDGNVFHEVVSPLVHVDLHLVPATEERPWQTVMTSGMAERPMTVPEGLEEHRYAELVLALPPEWPLEQEALDDERNWWPLRVLKQIARLPHEYDTFIWYGHTIPNGDPPEPYAENTELCCALITPPVLAPDGFDSLSLPDGRSVTVFGVVALHAAEMKFKLDHGAEKLWELLQENEVSELVDVGRPSVVTRKRRFLGR